MEYEHARCVGMGVGMGNRTNPPRMCGVGIVFDTFQDESEEIKRIYVNRTGFVLSLPISADSCLSWIVCGSVRTNRGLPALNRESTCDSPGRTSGKDQ